MRIGEIMKAYKNLENVLETQCFRIKKNVEVEKLVKNQKKVKKVSKLKKKN